MNFFAEHFCKFYIFRVFEFLLQLHDQIFDGIGVGDILEEKFFCLSGSLHLDVAIIEKGRNDTFDIGGNILDLFQAQLAGLPSEQPLLFNIDDALAGNDPDIEIVVNPNYEKGDPDEDEKKVAQKGEKHLEGRVAKIVVKNSGQSIGTEKQHEHDEDDEKLAQDIEPMTMQHEQNLFVRALSIKMIFIERIFHNV